MTASVAKTASPSAPLAEPMSDTFPEQGLLDRGFPDRGFPDRGLAVATHWRLDPAVSILNHGSFGAAPVPVLERQAALRTQMESEPVRFFMREYPALLNSSRQILARLISADPANLVFVNNATAGVNAVLRSLVFKPEDEILVTNHGYNACLNVARYVAERSGARVVEANLPLPVESPQAIIDAIMASVTPRTRIALIDHITSATAVILPIAAIVDELQQRGVDVLVDGAHAPGMQPIDLGRMNPAYYTGNCHKWLCAPKGAGFLYVRPDRQPGIQPPVISHGYNRPRPGYSLFQDAFDWQGTGDNTSWLVVGTAIEFLSGLVEGGLFGLARRNHSYAVAARRMLCSHLGARPLCPEEMLGTMAAVWLQDDPQPQRAVADQHPLNQALLEEFSIEVPVYYFPAPPHVVLRVSAQAYNRPEQYERLIAAVEELWPHRFK
jgi:isopenicillin-N epimerase